MGLFDNYTLKFHLDQCNEYMIENVDYCQDYVCILHLHMQSSQGAKLKEIDFAFYETVFWRLLWQLRNEMPVFGDDQGGTLHSRPLSFDCLRGLFCLLFSVVMGLSSIPYIL